MSLPTGLPITPLHIFNKKKFNFHTSYCIYIVYKICKLIYNLKYLKNYCCRNTCTLSLWLNEYIRTVFLDRQHSKVATTVESITKRADAWHAITTSEQIQELNIERPLLSVNIKMQHL